MRARSRAIIAFSDRSDLCGVQRGGGVAVFPLKPGGKGEAVTPATLDEYIRLRCDARSPCSVHIHLLCFLH